MFSRQLGLNIFLALIGLTALSVLAMNIMHIRSNDRDVAVAYTSETAKSVTKNNNLNTTDQSNKIVQEISDRVVENSNNNPENINTEENVIVKGLSYEEEQVNVAVTESPAQSDETTNDTSTNVTTETSSEPEIVYVQGPTGPQGPQGIQGLQGPVGPSSPSGLVPGYVAGNFDNNSAAFSTGYLNASNGANISGTLTANTVTVSSNLTVSGTITGTVNGTINPQYTEGSVIFQGSSGLAQDNSNFFWDDTNNYLGIGTASPTAELEVVGDIVSVGTKWTARSAAEANSWQAITYGNGLFVAVAGSGTNRVMTSPDGVTWTARSAAEANAWRSITYGNGLFVAVSSDGTNRVMTSPDGVTWTARSAAEANSWFDVTYGNGLFVAVSYDGTNRVMTSPDGVTWTARSAAEANQWYGVAYGNGLFVAVSSDGTNRVMTSPDGVTWTARSAAEANSWTEITYGNGLFVAVSSDGTNRVMTSPDGVTWTARSAAEANSWTSVFYGKGLFVVVAASGTNRVMTSPDGITWTARSAAEANGWYDVTYGNGLFVAISTGGTNRVMTSGKTVVSALTHNNTYQGGMNIYGNVGIGTSTPNYTLDVAGNIQLGTGASLYQDGIAIFHASSTSLSLAIGHQAGNNLSADDFNNVFLGYRTGYTSSNADGNSVIGSQALYSNVSGGDNSVLGFAAMYYNTIGSYNSAMGNQALNYNISGSKNVAIGNNSSFYNTSATSTVAIGWGAAYGTDSYYLGELTAIGTESLYNITTGAENNTAIGYRAGYANTSGANNIFVGYQAGDNVTTGSNNIIIGYDINASSSAATNQLNIGDLVYGDLGTSRVGIGTSTPSVALEIQGTVKAQNYLTSAGYPVNDILVRQEVQNYSINSLKGSTGLDVLDWEEKVAATVFESAITEVPSATALHDGNIFIAYKDSGNGGRGTYVIYNADGNEVVVPTIFKDTNIYDPSATTLNNGNAFIAYGTSGAAEFAIYNATGTQVVGPTTFSSGGVHRYIRAITMTNGNVFIVYNGGSKYFTIYDPSGNQVIAPKSLNYSIYISVTPLDNGNIAIAYSDDTTNYGTFVIYDANGNVVVSPTVFESAYVSDISVTTLSNGNFLIAYKDQGNSNYGTFVIYDANGNVVVSPTVFDGVGTVDDSSATTLSNGNIMIAYLRSARGRYVIYDSYGSQIKATTQFSSGYAYEPSAITLNNGNFFIAYRDGSNSSYGTFVIYQGSGAQFAQDLVVDGNVGIGTTTPSYKLHVYRSGDGDVAAFRDDSGTCTINPINTALACSSDIRLKRDIVRIDNALDKIMALEGVNYKWKSQTNEDNHIGFIAQDVQGIIPEMVHENADGFLSVGYSQLIPILTNAIQEQQAQIQELQSLALTGGLQGNVSGGLAADWINAVTKSNISGNLRVKGHVTFGKDTVGQAVILPGAKEVRVTFAKEYTYEPIVLADPVGDVALSSVFRSAVTNISPTGFTIKINHAQPQEVQFSWFALASDQAKVFVSDGSSADINIKVVENTPVINTSPQPEPAVAGTEEVVEQTDNSAPESEVNNNSTENTEESTEQNSEPAEEQTNVDETEEVVQDTPEPESTSQPDTSSNSNPIEEITQKIKDLVQESKTSEPTSEVSDAPSAE